VTRTTRPSLPSATNSGITMRPGLRRPYRRASLSSARPTIRVGTGWPSFTRRSTRDMSSRGRRHARDGPDRGAGRARRLVSWARLRRRNRARRVFATASTRPRLRFVPLARLDAEGYGFTRAPSPAALRPSRHDGQCVRGAKPGEAPGCEATLETAVLRGGEKAAASSAASTGCSSRARPEGQVRVTFDPKADRFAPT